MIFTKEILRSMSCLSGESKDEAMRSLQPSVRAQFISARSISVFCFRSNSVLENERRLSADSESKMIRVESLERGMKRGWRTILTKENAKEIDLPTKVSSYVMDTLDNITQKEYDEFGRVLNRVKTGNVKAIDLNQVIEDTLKQN